MNRREALAVLVAMPSIERIATVPATSDDVIVVECASRLTHDQRLRMRADLAQIWPDRKIVVLDEDLRIKLAPK